MNLRTHNITSGAIIADRATKIYFATWKYILKEGYTYLITYSMVQNII